MAGGNSAISRAAAVVATISAFGTRALPWVWSPLAWVLTRMPMSSAAIPVADRMARSIAAVSGSSNSVSTRRDWSPSTTSPALDQPQPPSGCSQA